MRSHRGAIAMWAIELIAVAAAAGVAWGAWELHKSGLRKEGILIQQKKDAEETARANDLAAKKAVQGKVDAEAATQRANQRRVTQERKYETDRLTRQAERELAAKADPALDACQRAPVCAGSDVRLRDHAARLQDPAGRVGVSGQPGVPGAPPPGFPTTPGKQR